MKLTTMGLIALAILGLFAAPLPADAQQSGKVYRIGWLSPTITTVDTVKSFREQLRALGWVEGQHFLLEPRFAPPGQREQLPVLAAELVQHNVDIIVTISTPGALAAKQATAKIPIVMAGSRDPVGRGLVGSLARPGGNVTGFTNQPVGGLFSKQLELLKEAAPGITRVGMLWNTLRTEPLPPARRRTIVHSWQTVAQGVGLTVVPLFVLKPQEYAEAFATFTRERADALLVFPSSLNVESLQRIVEFTTTERVPMIAGWSGFVKAGGLLSYWTNWGDLRRRAAIYVDKILKGTKPADLPVQQPAKFELVVNLKTAEALGLTIPPSMLVLADKVIR